MAIWDWSKTAASNTSVEGQSWAEGMDPAGINNGYRAGIAALAEFRDDQGGQLTTGGAANSYTLATNGGLTALADGVELGFVANHSCTGAATLNVDSLGSKAFRKITAAGEVALASGDMIAAGHYSVRYDASANSAAGAWILLNPIVTAYSPGGTDIALADGGTGASLVDPNADRGLFWDDSAGAVDWLTFGAGLAVTTTTLAVDTGTSGNKIPFLDGANTWSAAQTFSAAPVFSAAITLTGGQIAFPASQAASADANTLDDYEEGTWTPVLTFATAGDLSVVYSVQTGAYTKIGRMVQASFVIITTTFTHTTASGNCRITGLPFAAGSITLGSLIWSGITKASYTQYNTRIAASATQLEFYTSGSGQTVGTVAASNMPTAGTVSLQGSITYFV